MHGVDIWAALVAALSGFVVGGLWYGPLFQKPWMRHSGMTHERGKQQNVVLVFGGAYVLNLIAAVGLSMLMADHSGWMIGLHTGALTGLFFVAPALGVIYLFESRSFALWVVNAGYQVVNFAVMGTILGAWPW
jgi:hypothetical protein